MKDSTTSVIFVPTVNQGLRKVKKAKVIVKELDHRKYRFVQPTVQKRFDTGFL